MTRLRSGDLESILEAVREVETHATLTHSLDRSCNKLLGSSRLISSPSTKSILIAAASCT